MPARKKTPPKKTPPKKSSSKQTPRKKLSAKSTPAKPTLEETERQAFLTAITANPQDDTPRLVFADWLEEHGESDRAVFIRLGCQLAKMEEDDPQYPVLGRRLSALQRQHFEKWQQEAPEWARKRVDFWRGFIVRVVITATQWLKRADELLAAVPVTGVRLRRVSGEYYEILTQPSLARLTHLSLGWSSLQN